MSVRVQKLRTPLRESILNEVSRFFGQLDPKDPAVAISQKTLFKKLAPLKVDPKTASAARATFLETEDACKHRNAFIRNCFRNRKDFAASNMIYVARRKIAAILGSFNINEMLNRGRFGPGATYSCRGYDVSRARKFSLSDVTPEFEKFARGLLAEYPLWTNALTDADLPVCPLLDVVKGGRYSTVAKDVKTDRSIIVEPTINSWFQQSLGRMIRTRLKRVGVDLDDQTTNQRLAKLGSLTDDLATVDLSSASDRVCYELVKELLPTDWFFWLNCTRSHWVFLDQEWIKLEKFSSMGNGFTFDLQSLIFYALAYACAQNEGYNTFWVNTFGDDIVIPSGIKGPFLELFSNCGFLVNEDKSFFTGPFRESCGHDYYLGRNVRGVYVKSFRTDLDLLKLHNRVRAWGLRNCIDVGPLTRFIRKRTHLSQFLVPPSLGDVGFHSSFDECCPPLARDGWEGYVVKTLQPVLPVRERSDRFLLLDRLQGSEFAKNSVPLRSDPVAYRPKQVFIPSWD